MKIIGVAGQHNYRSRFIVEADEAEIKKLMGVYYDRDERVEVKPGLTFDVDAMFEKLYWLKRRNAEFASLIDKLRETANRIEESKPLFDMVLADDGEGKT